MTNTRPVEMVALNNFSSGQLHADWRWVISFVHTQRNLASLPECECGAAPLNKPQTTFEQPAPQPALDMTWCMWFDSF